MKQKELRPAEAISISAPVSTERRESPAKRKEPQPVDINRNSRKISGKGGRQSISPGSATSLRRTPRLRKVLFYYYYYFFNEDKYIYVSLDYILLDLLDGLMSK